MWKPSVILALAICTFFASSDAQDTCGSPTDAPGESTSTEVSNSGTLYFYPSFDSSCVGTVMAYEFCYRYTQITGPPDDVVSIVVLESEGENYRVVWTGNEREDRNCDTVTLIQGVDRCCDRTDLAADQMFNVSTNHAYGFVTPSITQNILLTLETRAHSYLLSAQAPLNDPDNLPAVGSTLTPTNLGISGMQLQSLLQRSVQFIIQPPPATDTPDPGTTDPGTTDPSTTDPSTTDPGTTDPGTTDPGTTDPGTTDPGTTDPGTTDPGTTDPGTTDPDTVGGGGANGGAIAAGVIIPLLVIGGVAVAVVIAMVIWRRRHSKSETIVYSGEPSKGNSYANAIYETQIDPHYSAQEKAGAETGEEGPHDYAVPDQTQFSKEGPQEYLESVPGIIPYAVLPGSNRTMPGMTTVASSGSPPAASTISTLPIAEQSHFNPYGSFISERGSIVTRSARHGSLLSNHQAPENIYMVPANDEQSLYAQIKAMNLRHIKRNTVKITDHLGSGQFGTVNRGEWESPDGAVEVAVKMLKAGSAQEDKVKFLQEAAMMGQFQHNNIVQLYGVVTIGEPKMIVLELLEKGDLHNHLKSLQLEGEKVDSELPHMLLSFSRQVASGLAYLAAKAFVHRDLAARNILVAGDGETIKIADFGMSRDLADENYYVAHGGKIPVKWTAPEAIHFKRYSTASDVWSFGAVMYEIWSLGYKPFEGYSNGQAMSMVDSRMRLPPPPGCPRAIYDIMIKCWHPDAAQRPDAAKIAQWLSRPDPQLLRWSEEDRAVHPEASLLGAELDATVVLYKELQETYINTSETH